MSDHFYRAFEDKFRGSRQEIRTRLEVYLPFVEPLSQVYPEAPVLDLGCGRGEWLELLRDHQIKAHGIDLDEAMLSACHDTGLSVETSDAIDFLARQPTGSAMAVTAFHLVEHIGFDALRQLVSDALRVLQPGGLLIMETPNPENLVVATQGFHLDPTHDKPIPPDLLAFVAEYAGYERIKILRLQESPGVHINLNLSLNDVLSGCSPDYAVVAQKQLPQDMMSLLKPQFDRVYGVSSAALAERYRHQGAENLAHAINTAHQSHQLALRLQAQTQDQFDALHVEIQRVQAQAAQWSQELSRVYGRRSWRITKPLRWLALQQRRLSEQGLAGRLKALLKKVGRKFWPRVVLFLSRHPAVRLRLVQWSLRLGLYALIRQWHASLFMPSSEADCTDVPVLAHPLTPNVRRIHEALKMRVAHKGDQ